MKYKLSSLELSLIILVLIVVGCKKETDSSMSGEWDVITHIYTVYQNDVKFSEESYSYKKGEFILVINADGTGKFIEDGHRDDPYAVTFTLEKISGNKFTLVQKPDPITIVTGEVEIVVNKNTLTWTATFIMGTSKYQNYIVGNRM
jgi:hypothetical protein